MSNFFPAVYSEGVFKPLKTPDLPSASQTYFLIALPSDEVMEELHSPIVKPSLSPEQRIADLVAELRADLAKAPNLDFNFDEEHQKMFLENARGLAPFIPGMIPEEAPTVGSNGNENG
jgi:predicted DNA-binding antitoxin AbrB/MazE fold protein